MCWFAEVYFEPERLGPCDGPIDRCHLIPKQRIKRHLAGHPPMLIHEAVWHPSVWVEGCRKHHAAFDNYRFRIVRSQLPVGVEHFAEIMEMGWSLDRDFGLR